MAHNGAQGKSMEEIDALVAEHIMGKKPRADGLFDYSAEQNSKGHHSPPPNYSSDMALAWDVVQKFPRDDVMLGPAVDGFTGAPEWHCSFDGPENVVYAEDMPMAICRAALLAKGIEF